MSWLSKLRRRVRLLVRHPDVEHEMDEEMRFHLEMEREELRRQGARDEDARRRALRDFGGLERYKEEARDARGGRWIDDTAQDLRYAMRVLRRSPGFTATAVLTLALGVGANTAIFSVVDAVLLRPLPYAQPEQLVQINSERKGTASTASPRDFLDWRSSARSFTAMAASFESTVNHTGACSASSGPCEPERLTQARVSANLFDLLGVRPEVGRAFAAGEDERSAPMVVVLSDALWRRRFAADPAIVGRTILLDGAPTTVIGVAPPDMHYPSAVDLWLTTRFDPSDIAESSRGARWVHVVARLAPGVTAERAQAEMATIARGIEQRDPKHNAGWGVRTRLLHDEIVGDVRKPLLVLLGAVGFVMLIACANVASLTLGRTAAREGELAVRAAMGAERGRITRQILTESMALSLVGGVAGLALALAGTRALVALAPADIPRLDAVRVDGTVLAFALVITALAGALFGIVPALQAASADLHARLRAGSRTGGARTRSSRARRVLVVSEVSLAIVLLAGAGLLIRSFARLRDVDPGFRTDGVSTFTVTLSPVKYPREDQQLAFSRALLERVRQLPGVQVAGITFGLPLSTTAFRLTFEIPGRAPASATDEPRAQFRVASPDYFRTLGIPLLRGRSFDDRDRAGSVPVALISQETARRYWPGESPIGQRVVTGWRRGGQRLQGEVIGVVGDVRQFGLDDTPTPHVYMASDQWPLDEITMVMRSTTPPTATLAAARAVVRELDPELPMYDVAPLAAMVADSLGQRRFYLMLLATFAGVALLLAAVGIYGVIAYAVQQRSREIGIRVALGATRENVLSMVLRDGLVLVLAGVAIGTLGAVALTGVLRTLLYDVSATDPVTFVVVPLLLLATGLLACAIPARRAVRLDPMLSIRGED